MAELVDALDSKSSSFGSGGSIPPQGTRKTSTGLSGFFYAPLYLEKQSKGKIRGKAQGFSLNDLLQEQSIVLLGGPVYNGKWHDTIIDVQGGKAQLDFGGFALDRKIIG